MILVKDILPRDFHLHKEDAWCKGASICSKKIIRPFSLCISVSDYEPMRNFYGTKTRFGTKSQDSGEMNSTFLAKLDIFTRKWEG